jgi:hypothetical protein
MFFFYIEKNENKIKKIAKIINFIFYISNSKVIIIETIIIIIIIIMIYFYFFI